MSRIPKILRDEKGKLMLADHLFVLYNGLLECPTCANINLAGTFKKSVAGKSNLLGERYRRYVCIKSELTGNEHCGRTLSTSKYIELCRDSVNVGSAVVHDLEIELSSMKFFRFSY